MIQGVRASRDGSFCKRSDQFTRSSARVDARIADEAHGHTSREIVAAGRPAGLARGLTPGRPSPSSIYFCFGTELGAGPAPPKGPRQEDPQKIAESRPTSEAPETKRELAVRGAEVAVRYGRLLEGGA